ARNFAVASNHDSAVLALDSVSTVPKDLEEIINKVVSGFKCLSKLSSCVPSMLETKCTSIAVSAHSSSAVVAISGPKSEPPTPILTTSEIALPENPRHVPLRTRSDNLSTCAKLSCTSAATFCVPTCSCSVAGKRRAVCSAARSSLVLTIAPCNKASIRPDNSQLFAKFNKFSSTASLIHCLL